LATLRALTIQNFRAISDPVRIEFKPITLLFGPNSAGKSTVMEALLYAREIFVNHNPNPNQVTVFGEPLDLGGFRNMVHNGDLSLPITVAVEIDLEENALSGSPLFEPRVVHHVGLSQDCLDCLGRVQRVSLSVSVCWDPILSVPYFASYSVELNDDFFCKLSDIPPSERIQQYQNVDQDQFLRWYMNLKPHVLGTVLNTQHPIFAQEGSPKSPNLFHQLSNFMLEDASDWHWSGDPPGPKSSGMMYSRCTGALPDWEQTVSAGERKSLSEEKLKEQENPDGYDRYQLMAGFDDILGRCILRPGALVKKLLRSLRYLGPLRARPPRVLEQDEPVATFGLYSGLGVWEELFTVTPEKEAEINQWLEDGNRLDTGYKIIVKRFREFESSQISQLDAEAAADPTQTEELIRKMPERARVVLRKSATGRELNPRDVGTGASQLIPVVIAALLSKDQMVTIEQPELHIHPALQAKLADLFIARIQEGNNLFLLETHSEHLMLRLLRRIRETSEDELPADVHPLTPDQVGVIFMEPAEGAVRIYPLRIDKTGEFTDRWPRGFFEEREEELF
jgi:hypothetical protein